MSKKHVYAPGHLLRLPETAPEGFTPDTRFRVLKVVNKAKVEVVLHQKQKGKTPFTVKVADAVWCPPVTRQAYKDRKKAEKAATKAAEPVSDEPLTPMNEEPEIPGDELPDFGGVADEGAIVES